MAKESNKENHISYKDKKFKKSTVDVISAAQNSFCDYILQKHFFLHVNIKWLSLYVSALDNKTPKLVGAQQITLIL
jgi:hypothetical protein